MTHCIISTCILERTFQADNLSFRMEPAIELSCDVCESDVDMFGYVYLENDLDLRQILALPSTYC